MPTALHAWIWDYSAILCSYSEAKLCWTGTVGQLFLGRFVWLSLSQQSAQGYSFVFPPAVSWEPLLCRNVNLHTPRSKPLKLRHESSILVSLEPAICLIAFSTAFCCLWLWLLSGHSLVHICYHDTYPQIAQGDHPLEESWLFQTRPLTSCLGLYSDIHY